MIKARPVAGDLAAGRAVPASRSRPSSGASISTSRRSRTSTRSSGRSTRISGGGSIARRRPQHQARPRRHPRDRVLRPDAAADLGRPRSRACAHAGTVAALAALADAGRIDRRRRRRPDRRLPLPAPGRAPAADDRRPADPHPARRTRTASRALAVFLGYADAGAVRRRHAARHCAAVERHYAELFEEAPTLAGPGQPRLHRHRGRSRHAARR